MIDVEPILIRKPHPFSYIEKMVWITDRMKFMMTGKTKGQIEKEQLQKTKKKEKKMRDKK